MNEYYNLLTANYNNQKKKFNKSFKEVFPLLLSGKKIKRLGWLGYWEWDNSLGTIIINTRDGKQIKLGEENVQQSLENILHFKDWGII